VTVRASGLSTHRANEVSAITKSVVALRRGKACRRKARLPPNDRIVEARLILFFLPLQKRARQFVTARPNRIYDGAVTSVSLFPAARLITRPTEN